MRKSLKTGAALLGIGMMAVPLIGATNSTTASPPDSRVLFDQAMPSNAAQKEVTALLKQIAARARATSQHAAKLESFARGRDLGFQTHAYELNRASDTINRMGADLSRLQELRAEALPWQQMVINRIQPMLSGMANHTTEAIESLNANRGLLHSPEYREAIGNVSDYADEVRDLISANVDYAKAQERLKRLESDWATSDPAAYAES